MDCTQILNTINDNLVTINNSILLLKDVLFFVAGCVLGVGFGGAFKTWMH
jgi:hypothetical protein